MRLIIVPVDGSKNLFRFEDPKRQLKLRKAVDDLFYQALAAEEAGALEVARKLYEQIVSHDSCCAEASLNLGKIFTELNNMRAAEACFRRAICIDPDYAMAHYNLGWVLDERDLLQKAIRHYAKAIELYPRYGDAHYNLAFALDRLGKKRRAAKHYQAYLLCGDYSLLHRFHAERRINELAQRKKAAVICRRPIGMSAPVGRIRSVGAASRGFFLVKSELRKNRCVFRRVRTVEKTR